MTGGRSRHILDRPGMRLIVALAAGVVAFAPGHGAQAFDFFGLWGSDDPPPPVSATALPYSVTIDAACPTCSHQRCLDCPAVKEVSKKGSSHS